ncbi:MAG: UvrD-helicase domain-containing protein [Candidatus Coatesbacteria bacterium]|nr:UvrD-helicase domain-containing protein [Candidatus Coatesbacteria bacterium]
MTLFTADLHIHSHYSIATSKNCNPENLFISAAIKGINLVGTGDFIHPKWLDELKEKMNEDGSGLLSLKDEFRKSIENRIYKNCDIIPGFVLTAEVSSIYKQDGKVRKNHNIIIFPDIKSAEKLSLRLSLIGNVKSDGRPILGISAHDLLEICLSVNQDVIFIPAHIWTPHFSLFGSKTGFDNIEDCFKDLTEYIHALETGLSSDPEMNWHVSALDDYFLVSNSDAHSPENLAREANIFNCDLSFQGISDCLKNKNPDGFLGTLEFFPEEGKYHLDGHRKCDICLNPSETEAMGSLCPRCNKPVTVGVLSRIFELSDRQEAYKGPKARDFKYIVPLKEIISDCLDVNSKCRKVDEIYHMLISRLGNELSILHEIPLEDIRSSGGEVLEEAIRRLRLNKVILKAGYDGVYGKIQFFEKNEIKDRGNQLFNIVKELDKKRQKENKPITPIRKKEKSYSLSESVLNNEQEKAVLSASSLTAVIAGPGTGKTFTLIEKINHEISNNNTKQEEIVCFTFTRKAALELKKRLKGMSLGKVKADTMHAIALDYLTEFSMKINLIDYHESLRIIKKHLIDNDIKVKAEKYLSYISLRKNGLEAEKGKRPGYAENVYEYYRKMLLKWDLLDYDDLLLKFRDTLLEGFKNRYKLILVDEFQDLNRIQIEIVKLLWEKKKSKLFVIGDPDQSIYGFRGSNARLFTEFIENYKNDASVFKLKRNYRSSQNIISAANCVIMNNPDMLRNITESAESADKPGYHVFPTSRSSAIFVAHEIQNGIGGISMLASDGIGREVTGGGKSFSDYAVLCRTNKELNDFAQSLSYERIPYRILTNSDFLEDENVIDILFILKAAVYENTDFYVEMVTQNGINSVDKTDSKVILEVVERIKLLIRKECLKNIIMEVIKSCNIEINEKVKQLLYLCDDLDDIKDLLITLGRNISGDAEIAYTQEAVSLLTMHAAKGLEFDTVFIANFQEGTIPFYNDFHECDLEEERRLFYVAMTRARRDLNLLYCKSKEGSFTLPSRFKDEIPVDLINVFQKSILRKAKQIDLL